MRATQNVAFYLVAQWTADKDPNTFPPVEQLAEKSKDASGNLHWTAGFSGTATPGQWFVQGPFWREADAVWTTFEIPAPIDDDLFQAEFHIVAE